MEATGGASMGMLHLQCVFDGSISGHHSDVNRRPYHRNCGCALHDKSSSSISGRGKRKSHRRNPSATTLCSASAVSFPVRRSKSHGCLSLASARAAISPSDQQSSRSSSSTCLWEMEMEMEMDRED